MKNKFSNRLMSLWLNMRYACVPPDGSDVRPLFRRLKISVPIAMMLWLNISTAQDFINTGTLTNTGSLKVKNQLTGLPTTINGTVELIGADQTLPAKQYQHVRLSGTGIKTTSGGDFSVQKNLTIAAAVTLQIPKGNFITLGDTLFESGILKGAIQKSVNLTGSTTSSNFGNIGATISWSSNAPGITNVIRASDSLQLGNGNQSIKRFYKIQPTDATATGNVVFKFSDSELNGHNINNLQLWRSGDNGATWERYVPVVDTLLKTISKTNVMLEGAWAMADTVRAIGPLQGNAGVPRYFADARVNLQPHSILTSLDTLFVRITDAFGTPVKNISVSFTIVKVPDSVNTFGHSLSVVNALTDTNGLAKTILTLGSKVGEYVVRATTSSLPSPVDLKSTAVHGAAATLAQLSGNNQTKSISVKLDTAFTVTVKDLGGNPVRNATVLFAITKTPLNAKDTLLSEASRNTDSLGRASTTLTLGDKVGTYTVKATVVGLVGKDTIFTAVATQGSPFAILPSGNNQSGVNGQPLANPFVAIVFDAGGNLVKDDTVVFEIQTIPNNGAILSRTRVVTDPLGRATTILTLGTKKGPYSVSAKSTKLPTVLNFNATALAGAASQIAMVSGNNQTATIATQLANDFVVHVVDASGNNVDTANVTFAIAPNTATGQSLSVTSAKTNTLGIASTRLTLGNKVGDYFVTASIVGIPDTTFKATATPGAAAAFAALSGNNQTVQIINPLANELLVRVVDAGGNNVGGSTVNFTIDSIPANATKQLLSKASDVSDANGIARTTLTAGNKVGTYRVKASGIGVPDTFFTAKATHGTAVAMEPSAGLNQIKPILTNLDSFTVHVTDIGGNDVPLSEVRFSITKTPIGDVSASISNIVAKTDSFGSASTRLKLGSKVGPYEVTAFITTAGEVESRSLNRKSLKSESSVNQNIAIPFTANATHGAPIAMKPSAGLNQTKPILTNLDVFTVHVTDIGGNDVGGSTVNFIIDSIPANATKQLLSQLSDVSDANGIARTTLTVGTKVGMYKVKAIGIGVPDTFFTAKATHGAVAKMEPSAGLNQTKPILTELDPFTAHVTDIGGNNVPLSEVRFAITKKPAGDTSASINTNSAPTDSFGFASTRLKLGSKVGPYEVTAFITTGGEVESRSINRKSFKTESSVSQNITITFPANASLGTTYAMNRSSGNSQNRPTVSQLDSSFAISLRDNGGNPVPNVSVKFVIDSIPSNAIGQKLRDSIVTTDSLGRAFTFFTLGDRKGTYVVSAIVNNVPTVSFTTTGYYVYGDVNNDIEVNIADITSVVDILTGKISATFSDSVKADFNRDGIVDTLDIQFIRNQILSVPLINSPINPETFLTVNEPEQEIRLLKKNSQKQFAGASAQFEVTPLGVRLNLENTIPVRGIEVRLHVIDSTIKVNAINLLFNRAKHMNVFVRSSGSEIRILAYNLSNKEIEAGSGSIFRIPQITTLEKVDTAEVILAVAGNSSVQPEYTKTLAPANRYPNSYALDQNFPNPFNGSTTIQFAIPDREKTTKAVIHIYNTLGQKVKTLAQNDYDPGNYSVRWDGTNDNGSFAASGVYFYRLMTNNYLMTKKMVYVK